MAPEKATTPVETPATPAVNDYDEMASAFDSLMEPSTPEGDPALAANEGAPKTETPPAEPKAETPPAEPPAPAAETPPAVETPPAEPVTESAEEVDWKKRFEELETRVKAQEPAAAQPQEPEQPPPEAPPLYTKDEEEAIAEYEKAWPENMRAESLIRRREYQQIVSHVFSEIQRVWGPLVQQGAQAAETVADTTTLAAIREVHNDYDDPMYDAVVEYANGLSGMKKRIALATIEEGEVGDVIDLITEYKTAKGLNKPKVVAGTGAPAPAASVTELPAAAKKAAKALGVVDSKRTATTTASDPNDFDGAWDEAVSSK